MEKVIKQKKAMRELRNRDINTWKQMLDCFRVSLFFLLVGPCPLNDNLTQPCVK